MVGSLGLICPVAASGHNYLAWIRQGGLNSLTAIITIIATSHATDTVVRGFRPPYLIRAR